MLLRLTAKGSRISCKQAGLIMAYWGASFGVLGVYVWQGSNERQAALVGAPAALGTIVRAGARLTK